ncbi:MAG: cytochrome c biogenesis protein CcdA [Gemmatimonadota bacterium]|nr:MAG: cytochrome c biogenesis protein CcdA [Gemmatimonadota bacterium]
MEEVTIFAAFIAGVISFGSPCVLPLVPAYISVISGISLDELKGGHDKKLVWRKVSLNSIAFILGFSTVFVLLGASATVAGQFLLSKLTVITKIAGVLIIIFGLHTIGLFRLKFLYYEKRFQAQQKSVGLLGSFVIGLAFAFGWTPCIGPILAAILIVAGTQETVLQGISLLAIYSLGLGLPFFITGLSINFFLGMFSKMKWKFFRTIEIVSGVFLIVVGVLIFTNYLSIISSVLMQWFPWLNLG